MSQVFEYDIPRACVQEVSASLNWKEFADELQRTEDKAGALRAFGELLMQTVIDAADRYKDRTGEMIEQVARQTGVNFPHRAQRYIEHMLLCARPADRYGLLKSTPGELRFTISSCSILPMVAPGAPCRELCVAALQRACQKTGDDVTVEVVHWLPTDGRCEFSLKPRH